MCESKCQTLRAARPTRAGDMAANGGHTVTHPTQAVFQAAAPLTEDRQFCQIALTVEDVRYLIWILDCHLESIERDPQMCDANLRPVLLEAFADVERLQAVFAQARDCALLPRAGVAARAKAQSALRAMGGRDE